MNAIRRSVAVLVAVLLPSVARAGNYVFVDYYVNVSSFSPEFGGVSPVRIIEQAGAAWTAYGGSQQMLRPMGATVWDHCGTGGFDVNPNTIAAINGCSPADWPAPCVTRARMSHCSACVGCGWITTVYLGAETFVLTGTGAGGMDFQGFMTHEMGHEIGLPDYEFFPGADTKFCAMVHGQSTGTATLDRRYPCQRDIADVGNFGLFPNPLLRQLTTTSLSPNGSSWTSATTGTQGGPTGAGYAWGAGSERMVHTYYYGSSAGYSEQSCAVPNCTSSGNVDSSAPSYDTSFFRRPTMVYDYTRGQYWVFYNKPDSTPRANTGNPPEGILYRRSYDGLTWSGVHEIRKASGCSGQSISSRLPVSATYDYWSDQIVIAYTAFSGDSAFGVLADGNCGLGGCTGSYPGESCTGDINIMTVPASHSGVETDWKGPYRMSGSGITSAGSPAIACERSLITNQCVLVYTNSNDVNRHLWSLSFCISSSGLCGHTTPVDMGGWTDFPPSLTYNGYSANGVFLMSVTGADATRIVVFNKKNHPGDAWQGWNFTTYSAYWGPVGQVGPNGVAGYRIFY